MRLFVIALAIAFMMFSQSNAQVKPLPSEKIQKVASTALATFSELVTKENYKTMGFDSLNEVRTASPGDPLRVFMVRLDQLQEYQPGSDPNKILSGGDRVIYPIEIGGQVRSSFVVAKVEERWEATNFGGANLIKMLTRARKAGADSTGLPISSYFVVRVPALNLYFIAHRADEVLMLSPMYDDRGYGFKVGVTLKAEEVFKAILPAAKGHDGLPR